MDQPIMKKRGIYGVIVALLVIGVTTLACLLYIDRMQFGNSLQARYQKQLYDLIGNVQSLETDLSKVGVTSSAQSSTLLFGDIWRQAGAAADSINSLPITHTAISQTSKFLAQVSNFSYSLVRSSNDGNKLTDDDWNKLESLRNNASYLRAQLMSLESEMQKGKITWSEIRYEGGKILGKAQTNIVDKKFADIQKSVQQPPTLIYDGPFSENVLNITPKVTVEPVVTIEQAKQKVIDAIGRDKIKEIGSYSNKGDGNIPSYPFQVILKNRDKNRPISIDISKNGGHLIYMLDSRVVRQPAIDTKKAIGIGLNYLNKNGYKDMIPSFSQRSDNTLVVNYVMTQSIGSSNAVIYPDQIKVKIALDNGDVIGFESQKYLTAHTMRKLSSPKLSVTQARAKASSKIQVTNSRLVLIPLLSSREVLCYEFIGRKDASTFAVYINANTGKEENILQIIDTPDGQLAI